MDLLAIFGVGTNLMFSLGIIFVIVITLFYVRQRLSDYDSKMSSILQVISGISNEVNMIKSTVGDYKSKLNKLETIVEVDEEKDEDLNVIEEMEKEKDLDETSENDEDDDEYDEDDDEYDEDDDEDDDEEDDNEEIREVEQTLKSSIDNIINSEESHENTNNLTKVIELDLEDNTGNIEDIKNEVEEDLTKMTISQLKEFALKNGIGIAEQKKLKKNELLEVIQNELK